MRKTKYIDPKVIYLKEVTSDKVFFVLDVIELLLGQNKTTVCYHKDEGQISNTEQIFILHNTYLKNTNANLSGE